MFSMRRDLAASAMSKLTERNMRRRLGDEIHSIGGTTNDRSHGQTLPEGGPASGGFPGPTRLVAARIGRTNRIPTGMTNGTIRLIAWGSEARPAAIREREPCSD